MFKWCLKCWAQKPKQACGYLVNLTPVNPSILILVVIFEYCFFSAKMEVLHVCTKVVYLLFPIKICTENHNTKAYLDFWLDKWFCDKDQGTLDLII